MADIQPLRTLRYDPRSVGSLEAVAAPPYDVIDAPMRAELQARSPFNVVEIDLPEAPDGGDPYQHAQETLEEWTHQGILVREREPALWVMTQDYTGPDGNAYTRHGFFARVRVDDYGPGRIRSAHYLSGASTWTVGENIAWGSYDYATPRSIVRSWMHSPPHRANILRSQFRDIGIGLSRGAPVRGQARAATYATDFGARY